MRAREFVLAGAVLTTVDGSGDVGCSPECLTIGLGAHAMIASAAPSLIGVVSESDACRRRRDEGVLVPRNYSPLTLKQLFLTSGHFCAFPGCPASIVEFTDGAPTILGFIAHIEGSSDDGPRPNPDLTAAQRDSYDNLLILCGHHHTLVDKIDAEYPVEMLREWKRAAERATAEKLSIGAGAVSFAELQIVCNAFADGDVGLASTPMIAVPPQDKMDANSLSDAVKPTMNVGLSQAAQAAEYLRRQAQLSSRFPERLRAGFVAEYDRLRASGLEGDSVFFSLIDFGANSAATPQTDLGRLFVIRAAAAAVLCHLFEVCDVFEAPA